MKTDYKVIVAGSICLDITPVFTKKEKVALTEVLAPGKMNHLDKADIHTGGAVSNTGLAMKFLGMDVTLAGKIGDDSFGNMVENILKEHEASDGLIIENGGTTSFSIIMAIPGSDRIFFHAPGNCDTFGYDDLDFDGMKDAVLFHFGYPTVLKRMYQNDGEELVRILKRVKEMGMITSMDMAAIDPKSEAGLIDWHKFLETVLPYVDIFVPSLEEMSCMLNPERHQKWLEMAGNRELGSVVSIQDDVAPMASYFLSMGPQIVLIKCGVPGIYYQTKEVKIPFADPVEWSNRSGFERSFVPDKVLSNTGAGDTTVAAFLTALLYGNPLDKSISLAAAQGAASVSSYDALGGLMSIDQLQKRIDNGWEKQHLLREDKEIFTC